MAGRRRSKKSKGQAWAELSDRWEGDVTADKRGKPKRVTIPAGPHRIVLDTYTVSNGTSSSTYTRVRALFESAAEFRCKISRRNPFHALAPLFGRRPTPIGYRRFESAFFVRGTDPERLRYLLQGTQVSQLLLADPKITYAVKRPGKRIRKAAGDDIREIHLQTGGVVRDVERLSRMVELSVASLDKLIQLGIATAEAVPTEL